MNYNITKCITGLLLLLLTAGCADPPAGDWNKQGLDDLEVYGKKIGTSSFVLITEGQIIRQWGDQAKVSRVHSVRKSFLSALVGQHTGSGEGMINLERSLAELGIDDYPNPLTELQKTARVIHLIRSTSGINHTAAAETPGMTRDKTEILGTGENQPGTLWAYNNWDYNTLTTIFEQETGLSVYEAFKQGIAEPLDLQDFQKEHVFYVSDPDLSLHAKVGFEFSTRDMAKFAMLYLQEGRWKGKQIIPQAWIERITGDYSYAGRGLNSGHGYLWWVPCDLVSRDMGIPEGTYIASGFGGQRIAVIPAWNTVFVHKVNTSNYEKSIEKYMHYKGVEPSADAFTDDLFDEFFGFIATAECDKIGDDVLREICEESTFVTGGEFTDFFRKLVGARQSDAAHPPPRPSGQLPGNVQTEKGVFSNVACMKSCFEYLGYRYSDAFLYGGLGYAFLMHVNQRLDPIQLGIWNDGIIYRNANNLGADIKTIAGHKSSPGFKEKQEQAWDQIRAAIDKNCPSFGFNLFYPSNYVIYGYDERGYYFKGPDRPDGIGPREWHRVGLDNIGWLEFHIFCPTSPKNHLEIARKAMEFAIKQADSPAEWVNRGNKMGPAGYDLWISAISEKTGSGYGMAHYADVWLNMRAYAVSFLKEVQQQDPAKELVSDLLISHYENVHLQLKELAGLFPKSIDNQALSTNFMDEQINRKAIHHLSEARRFEVLALKEMRQVILP